MRDGNRHARRRLAVALGASAAALCLAACDAGGAASPREAWAAARTAIETRDPKGLHDLLDRDSQEERRQGMRQIRALLARGEPAEEVLAGTNFDVADVTTGSLDDAIGLAMAKGSPFVRDAQWFLAAAVAEEAPEGDDASKLVLRGPDGKTFPCWFVREPQGWVIDFARTWVPR